MPNSRALEISAKTGRSNGRNNGTAKHSSHIFEHSSRFRAPITHYEFKKHSLMSEMENSGVAKPREDVGQLNRSLNAVNIYGRNNPQRFPNLKKLELRDSNIILTREFTQSENSYPKNS
jgi:hypothetical protein